MFRNRSVQIKMVKTDPASGVEVEDEDFEARVEVIADAAKELMWEAAKVYAGYVLVDTCRKVLITLAARPYS